MGWIIECDGQQVMIPFDVDFIVPQLEGRFPNGVMLEMDEAHFERYIAPHAAWVGGAGEFASLAYCGGDLTIIRFSTLDKAVEAKKIIDSGGCGGQCVKVHVIARLDPQNSRAARQKQNVRDYIARRA